MPKVTDAHREARRVQIIDAALVCFARKGFQGASMTDIFTESGLSAGAVYSYFSSKQELAASAAMRVLEQQLQYVSRSAEPTHVEAVPAPSRALRNLAEALDRAGISARIIVQLWGEAATDPKFRELAVDALASVRSALTGFLARWARETRGVTEAEAAEYADDVLPVMMSLTQGYLLQSAVMPDFDLDSYLRAVERVLG